MIITLTRYRILPDSCDGTLSIDGVRYCDTAEPTPLMIPEGTYPVSFRRHPVQRHRAPYLGRGYYLINGSGVFHPTRGDILLGEHIVPGCVKCSRTYFDPLVKRLEKAFLRGTKVSLIVCSEV